MNGHEESEEGISHELQSLVVVLWRVGGMRQRLARVTRHDIRSKRS
jgi:hypothetical protein